MGVEVQRNIDHQSEDRLTTLDGYRALAILSVIAFHYTVRWATPYDPDAHFPSGNIFNGLTFFEYGWLGVELFFIISGFVIVMTLSRCNSVAEFICRRFARIWPPLVVAASLTTILLYVIGPSDWLPSWPDYLTSLLLIDESITVKLLPHGTKWVDGVYWSLAIEIRFYILAAIVYLLAGSRFVAAWLLLLISVCLATVLVNHAQTTNVNGILYFIFFPQYLPYFTIGICVHEIYRDGPLRRVAIGGAIMAAGLILRSAAFESNIFTARDAFTCILANIIIFFLFWLFVIGHPVTRVFRSAYIVSIGQSSYSLYLLHQYIGISVMSKFIGFGIPYLLVLPATVFMVIYFSMFLFRYVEVPAKSLILKQSRPLVNYVDNHLPWLSYK